MKTLFINRKWVAVLLVFFTAACSSDFLDINDNPNNPTEASITLLLPGAQVATAFSTSRTAVENAGIFVQHFYNLSESTYGIAGNLTDNDFNGIYDTALKDLDLIIKDAETLGLAGHAGIAKVLTAYLYSVLVDLWGEVPFTEALQGETNFNPKFDEGSVIYDGILDLLDEAKVDFDASIALGSETISTDLIYGGDLENWKRAANTIKLKVLLNLRLVDPARATTEIQSLIDEDFFIEGNSQDFQFQYGSSVTPLNQHPIYQQDYVAGNKTFYMNNYFMYNMVDRGDPRINYYIYRQGTFQEVADDFQILPCNSRSDCDFWVLMFGAGPAGDPSIWPPFDGYIGRDHGDPSGIPGDNGIRATWGVYPIGGSYDDNARNQRILESSTGEGIVPWVTNSMRAFMLAEATLILGTTGDPRVLMTEGIGASMDKVAAFGSSIDPNAPATIDDANYVADRQSDYDAALLLGTQQTLDVIIKEKYYSQFGNGLESYNDFRRTGFPSDLPASLAPAGPFPLRFPLGPTELTSNANAPDPAPLVTKPVFWDIN